MSRSLAYSLAFMASACFSSLAAGQSLSESPAAQQQGPSSAVKVSFSGDPAPAAGGHHAVGGDGQQPLTRWQASEFKQLPPQEAREKAAVILPASSRMGMAGGGHGHRGHVGGNWTDPCVHCGTGGCDGYGCGFGQYHEEPTRFAPGGLWIKSDYLYWRISGNNVPALVTASPFGTERVDLGVLPGAQVLFGNEPINEDFRSGGRIQAGLWLDDCEKWGIQGEFVGLEESNTAFFIASDGNPGVSRPFFNIDPNVNGEDARLIGFDDPDGTDELDGFVDIDTSSNFYSGGALLRRRLSQSPGSRWDFLVGYRFTKLDESLTINDQSIAQSDNDQILGTVVEIRDAFSTDNEFHGVDLGIAGSWDMGRWALEGMVKCALGNNQQTVTIDGSTTIEIPGNAPFTNNQGLLAQTTNIGQYERDQFTILPEARASASYFLTDHIRVTGGYTMIYVDTVVRPGDQIDRVVNGTLLEGPFSGPMRPAFQFNDSKVFIHGANVGLDIMF